MDINKTKQIVEKGKLEIRELVSRRDELVKKFISIVDEEKKKEKRKKISDK